MNNKNNAKILLALMFLIVPVTSAVAGSLQAVINGKSFHINSDYDWNEENYGIGIEYEFEPRAC